MADEGNIKLRYSHAQKHRKHYCIIHSLTPIGGKDSLRPVTHTAVAAAAKRIAKSLLEKEQTNDAKWDDGNRAKWAVELQACRE